MKNSRRTWHQVIENSLLSITAKVAQCTLSLLRGAWLSPADTRRPRHRRRRPRHRLCFAGFEPLEARAMLSVTLLNEGFEGSFPSSNAWSVGDANSSGTAAYWDDVDSSFGGDGTHSGSWKGYCADIGNAGTSSNPTYQNYMGGYMSRGINLAGLSSANLSFWYKIPSIESGNYDHLRVYIDSTKVFDVSASATAWTQANINLTSFVGGSHTLKFQFDSDVSGTAEGAYLDDILVTGEQQASGPTNNNFANRLGLAAPSQTIPTSNVNATKESGEPNHAGNSGGKSVWFQWTPLTSGQAQIDTIGSNFDTLLGVYTGSSVTSLTTVASDDDSGSSNTSKVTFNAVAGTSYKIAVDGYNGTSGSIVLHVIAPSTPVAPLPPNGVSASDGAYSDKVRVNWTAATNASAYEVWRSTNNSSGSAVKISASDVTGTTYDDTNATPGTTYWYWIKAKNAAGASGFSAGDAGYRQTTGPANDNFASRPGLGGASTTMTGTNANATKEAGEPNHAGNSGGRSVWYQWTAPASGQVQIDTIGSSFDTILGVYTGNSVSSLTTVAGDDDSGGSNASKVNFNAMAGTSYQIAVDGYNGNSGSIVLHVNLTTPVAPPAPTNVSASDGAFTNKVRVTWTASASASAYEVWRSTSNNSGTAVKINSADVTGTTYDDLAASPGTAYWYWVKAKNSSGTSGFSAADAGNRQVVTGSTTFPATAITARDSTSQYATSLNAFSPENSLTPDLNGQCTWYAYGRVIELVNQGHLAPSIGTLMHDTFWGVTGRDAKNWPSMLGGTWTPTTGAPLPMQLRVTGQLAVWVAGEHGHVGFVEEISADKSQYRLTDFNRDRTESYNSAWYNFEGSADSLLGTYPRFLQLPLALPASTQLLTNGGFETGNLNGWMVTAGGSFPRIVTGNTASGAYALQLGDGGSGLGGGNTASIQQTVNIPASSSAPMLNMSYLVQGTDGPTWDWMRVYVNGTQVATWSSDSGGWRTFNYDLSAYRGQSVTIRISSWTADTIAPVNYFLDDLSVIV